MDKWVHHKLHTSKTIIERVFSTNQINNSAIAIFLFTIVLFKDYLAFTDLF